MKQKLLLFLSLFLLVGGGISYAVNHVFEITTNQAKTNAWDWGVNYKLTSPLENGETYVLTLKASTTDANLTSVRFWPQSEDKTVLYTGFGVDTEWQNRTLEFTANADLNLLIFNFGDLNGKLVFDDLKLVKKGTDNNLIEDGDFENGEEFASGWNFGWNKPTSYAIVEQYKDFKAVAISNEVDIRTAPWYKNSKGETDATEEKDYVLTENPTGNGACYNVGTSASAYYAALWNGEKLNYYADFAGYKTIRVYQADDTNVPRAFFINAAATGHQQVTGFVWNESGKYYELDLTLADKAVGNRKLTSLRATGTGTCTGLALTADIESDTKGYILTGDAVNGKVTESVTAALNDASATYYDATGLTNTTEATLKIANPNAIIAAKSGVLENESNVAVDGTISNLVLTDGYSFQAPDEVKATKAQYTRELNAKYGTVVLPFAATSDDVKFYAIKNMTDEAITLEEVAELAAGTPAIIEKTSDDAKITITGEGNVNSDITEATQADGAVMMHGSYTQGTTVTDENSYYIKGDKFYSINENFICNAFRGYFTTVNKNAAARLSIITDNNVTGVNAVETQEGDNAIVEVYNAAGVQQKGMQKGVNIVRLANGKTVTVIVK